MGSIYLKNPLLTVVLKIEPTANPIPSATKDTMFPIKAKRQKRNISCGNPAIKYTNEINIMFITS